MPAISEIYVKKATSDKASLELNAIVYATDLSLGSQNAGLFAMHIAACLSARLLVVHAFTLSQSALEVEILQSRSSQQRQDLNALLAGRTALLTSDNVEAIPKLLEGNPQKIVPEVANFHAPSLIVMGAYGGGRFGRGVFGSVSEQILWSSPLPSLTVGPKVPLISLSIFPCKKLLYVTDFTAAAAHAAEFAVTFAEALGAEIDVLGLLGAKAVLQQDRLADSHKKLLSTLDDHEPTRLRNIFNSKTHVAVGKAHDRIIEVIKERSIDMLVLGIQKASRFGMEKRTPDVFQLIVDAQCPVLTVRI